MVARLSQWSDELIEHQRGVLARWQLADRPDDLSAIDSLVRSRRWQMLYRGVYAAYTGPPAREATLWAAVLRCGPSAALSHFTAAELDGLADRPGEAIHVTIPGHLRVSPSEPEFSGGRPRIVVHRSARCDAAKHPARTPTGIRTEETVLDLVDLADTFDVAFGWLSTACGRRLVTVSLLSHAAAGRAKLRWRTDVAVALGEISEGVMSNLERGFLRLVERPTSCRSRDVKPSSGKVSAPRILTTFTRSSAWRSSSMAWARIQRRAAGATSTGTTTSLGPGSSLSGSAGPTSWAGHATWLAKSLRCFVNVAGPAQSVAAAGVVRWLGHDRGGFSVDARRIIRDHEGGRRAGRAALAAGLAR
jgi:hypothetical protein